MSAVEEQSPRPSLELEHPVLESKLAPAAVPRRAVSRTSLINRLRAVGKSVVVIVAPAGYGKTTLLSQWIERDARPAVWVSVDESDNDPAVFLSCVAAGLDRALELDPPASDALAAPTWKSAAKRLASALLSSEEPVLVAVDDAHLLFERDSLRVLDALACHLPPGATLALTARTQPRLPLARLRARGLLFELGADELAMNRQEARSLLRSLGAPASEEEIADLVHRTEGWPAGLYLAGLSLGTAGPRLPVAQAEAAFAGDHLFVADYLRLEFVSALTEAELSFLTRISVLDRFCRPLCAAVLGRTNVSAELDRLVQSGQFVVSLDHRGEWYRFHHLLRETLRAELDRREPEIVPELNSRAAHWCEAHGMAENAVEYARAAGDTERVARLVSDLWLPVFDGGGMTTVARWLGWLDGDVLERSPGLAVAEAWVHAFAGRSAEARCWREVAAAGSAPGRKPGPSGALEPQVGVLRAAMCENGVDAMRADAGRATGKLAPRDPFRSTALLLLGVSHVLAGDHEDAVSVLTDVADRSSLPGGAVAASVALAELALLAVARNDHAEAEALAWRARDAVRESRSHEYVTAGLVHAVVAHAAVRGGDLACVRSELARATSLLPKLDYALPWLSIQTRLTLARVHLAVGTEADAEGFAAEIDVLLRRRPGLGALVRSAHQLCEQIAVASPAAERRVSGLTSAELRLLPLLTTHLSFREIAELLFVSRNTVKTQAISVYRKLGVSSRSEAIARAADLGLVDDPAMPPGV